MYVRVYVFQTASHYVVPAGLELIVQPRLVLNSVILLPQPPKHWDYRNVPLCPAEIAVKDDRKKRATEHT